MKLLCSYRDVLFTTDIPSSADDNRVSAVRAAMAELDSALKVVATMNSPVTTVLFQFVDDHYIDLQDVLARSFLTAPVQEAMRFKRSYEVKLARIRSGESLYTPYKFGPNGKRVEITQKECKLRIAEMVKRITSFRARVTKLLELIGYDANCVKGTWAAIELSAEK